MEDYISKPSSPFQEFCLLSLSPLDNPERSLKNYRDDRSEATQKTSSSFLVQKKDPTKRVTCNCRRTKCIKLYCECFANGMYCKDCGCIDCANTLQNDATRLVAIVKITERNPEAFRRSEEIPINTCNCKRSGCRKKYCACYSTGRKCGLGCKCLGCRNLKYRKL